MSERLPNRQKIMSIGEDMEKRQPLYTVGGTVNGNSHLWKIVWRFLKKLRIELPHEYTILRLTRLILEESEGY